MQNTSFQTEVPAQNQGIHFGHFGIIALSAFLLLGISYMEKPQLFNFKKTNNVVASADIPHYYPYVAPPEDQPQPEVLGASTDQGPSVIGDDGTVEPVDMGQVLAASTQDVVLDPTSVKVNQVPESSAAVTAYFTNAAVVEAGFTGDSDFASALASGNQDEINQYAQKLTTVRDALIKLPVPQGLVKLQQLKIIQYNAAIDLLQNFTQGDQNPDLVNEDMEQFLKSQQDLDAENTADAQKYGSLDPESALYVNPDGTPVAQPSLTPDSSGDDLSSLSSDNADQ